MTAGRAVMLLLVDVTPTCPLCGGDLVEIRAKAVCARCGRICEGCCEGAPGVAGPQPVP